MSLAAPGSRVRLARLAFSLLMFLLCSALSRGAAAHDPFEITTQVVIAADSLDVEVTLSSGSARQLLDVGSDSRLPLGRDELAQRAGELETAAARLYDVTAGGRALRFLSASASLTDESDVQFRLKYERPDAGVLRLHARHLERLDSGYTNAVTVSQEAPKSSFGLRFLDRETASLEVQVRTSAAHPQLSEAPAAPRAEPPAFAQFFTLGVEHLFTGYDHLLFLAALLLAGGGIRAVITLVTCFTLAHSLTLALASLDVIVLPSTVVEPLIAVSIVCVALDNLLLKGSSRWRPYVTICFGLIHGFGFATVLRELGLGGQGLTTLVRLFAFNLGIEVGQLAIALLTVPLLAALRRRNWLGLRTLQLASIAIALFGLYWLVERTVGA